MRFGKIDNCHQIHQRISLHSTTEIFCFEDINSLESPFNGSVQKSSCEDSGVHVSHSRPDGNADNRVDDSITKGNSATLEVNVDMRTEGNEAEYASREAARMNHAPVEEDIISYQQDESSKSPNRAPEQYNTKDGSFEHAEQIQGKHGEENDNTDTAYGSQQEDHIYSDKQTSKRRKRRSCYSNMKQRSKTMPDESQGDKQMRTLSHENEANKQTNRKSKDGEEKKQKKTVTPAGTKCESGVRRSTRIKSRPLEYWRGERFLFGRIHENLTTLIGVKYASPPDKGDKGKRVLKVKSFVSDDYKELVDLAAMN